MNYSVFVLCVVLPSLCVCTPLPDSSATASSQSSASVQTNGAGNVSANSHSDATASVNNPPSVLPTVPVPSDTTPLPAVSPTVIAPDSTPTPPSNHSPHSNSPSGSGSANASSSSDASASQHGGSASANANSNAHASAGGSSGKPTQQGFTSYSVLKISNDEFKSKIEKTTWFVAEYTQSQEQIQSDVTVCAARCICSSCKAVKFQYVSENGKFIFKEWGYDGTCLMYIQENISFSAQDFVILKSDVVNVMKATKDSNTASSVSNSKQVKSHLNSEYAVLGTDYKNYFVGQTSSEKGSITFVAFIQEIYECEKKQKEYAQQISKVLKHSGIDQSKLSKLTQKFDIDTNKYNWEKCEKHGSSDGKGSSSKQETKQKSSSSSDASTTQNGGASADDKGSNNSKQEAKQKSSSASDANASQHGGSANADSHSSASASASCCSGKPTQQGFTSYSVLKTSDDKFKSQINKTTWFVAKYTQSQEQIKSDVTVCADRHICSNCKAVKFQYVSEKGKFIFKEWGYDGTSLLYIQEKISFSTQDFVILKADVINVMKATKDSNTASSVSNNKQVKSHLSSEYAVLGTDYKNYFVGQTSSEKGSITFVAFIQEIYECEKKQQEYAQQISKVLKHSGIDESKLSKLTQKFDIDTNKYNWECETHASSDGKSTTEKQETHHHSGTPPCCGSPSSSPSPSPSSTPSPPTNGSGGSGSAGASASSDASAHVNTSGSPSPSTVNANASSSSNASVNSTNGNTSVNANSHSDASVQVTTGSP